MDRTKKIYLIGTHYEMDAIRQQVAVETRKAVFAQIDSISRAEFNAARTVGLNPSLSVTIWAFEYTGEKFVELNGEKYSVYRTFARRNQRMELYLERMPDHGS
jgi:SPP1 family predicted phage head-tail adaptor